MRPLRLVVRTLPSQGSNTGSSPVGVIMEEFDSQGLASEEYFRKELTMTDTVCYK